MALVLNDRVKETTTSTGTGTINLAGAETGFETFVAGVGNSNTCYYCIAHQSADEFEVGLGTITDATPDTLARTTVISSSNSDSAVDFSAGTKDVFCTLPASKAVFEDASNNVAIPSGGVSVGGSSLDPLSLTFTGTGLALNEDSGTAFFQIDSGNGSRIDFGVGGTRNFLIYSDASNYAEFKRTTNHPILFGTNNAERMRVLGGGGLQLAAGNNISNASGDLTIDCPADIVLDADGGNIEMKDDGLHFYSISRSGDNAIIQSVISNGDVVIQGNDGGSTITALTLDMSEAGSATFNSNITLGDNKGVYFGAGSDLIISSDGTDAILDASGDIILDADGTSIKFQDGGTLNSRLGLDSAGLIVTIEGADKDFFINGDDGGSAITAIRVDMSDAGALICNGNITAFGSPSDIRLKENIEVIPDALDKVKQLKGVTFNYKKDGKKSTGLIAQDLEKVLPEVVYETSTTDKDDEEKHLAVRYGNTVGLLVEAIKEQQEQIETLTAKVKELEDK